jgi:hypothetical protein
VDILLISSRDEIDRGNIELRQISNKIDISAQDVLQALANDDATLDNGLEPGTEHLDAVDAADSALSQNRGRRLTAKTITLQDYFPRSSLHYIQSEYIEPAILQALAFPGMHERYETVPKAHKRTYSWIFQQDSVGPWDSFVEWLRSGEQIYWVNGKAASGKSTLMRYILESPQLHTHLEAWRADLSLEIGQFYFWATGTQMQKSQIGLFCSILHQMLSTDFKLIRIAFPELFNELQSAEACAVMGYCRRQSWRPWSLEELKQSFLRLLENTSTSSKYCLLVDGLDEFNGNHLELTTFFKETAMIRNVKICVSSRPLLEFDDQLGNFPKLRLQDLTVGDITRFVHDELTAHPRFREISMQETKSAANLVDEIVQMSAGVFLWVSLVVRSILQGLTNHDGIGDLQRRLRALPPELDDLYSLMLNSISPPFYLVQCSKLLQLIYQSPDPINAVELSFADDADDDLVLRYTQHDLKDIFQRCKDILPKVKSRCAGLLEVNYEGDILHSFDNALYVHELSIHHAEMYRP